MFHTGHFHSIASLQHKNLSTIHNGISGDEHLLQLVYTDIARGLKLNLSGKYWQVLTCTCDFKTCIISFS